MILRSHLGITEVTSKFLIDLDGLFIVLPHWKITSTMQQITAMLKQRDERWISPCDDIHGNINFYHVVL